VQLCSAGRDSSRQKLRFMREEMGGTDSCDRWSLPCWYWEYLSFAKSLCPALKGYLPVWRTLFGMGLQADSSTGERCSQKT
jgi:hypothetical protein